MPADVTVNLSPVAGLVTNVESIIQDMRRGTFMPQVVSTLRDRVDFLYVQYMNHAARENPHQLHHVYEWGEDKVGSDNPRDRLFRIVYARGTRGGGGVEGAHLQIGYDFQRSTTTVPWSGGDAFGRSRRFQFRAKAWIFEQGHEVTIAARRAKVNMAFPVGPGNFMIYTRKPIKRDFSKQATVGQFALHSKTFFAGIESLLRPELINAARVAAAAAEAQMVGELKRLKAPRAIKGGSRTRITMNVVGFTGSTRKPKKNVFAQRYVQALKAGGR